MANSDMIVRVQADTKNYDANLAKASKTLKQFADNNLSMGGILKQSTGALTGMAASVLSVTAAIGAAKKVVGDMVRINMQFEQSSSNLAAVLGTSRDQITALTDQAKALGATTQYTASQILELQANLARLGFNQNEILNSTKSVQAMATAMGADLGEAANLAGSALRGFGLNATEMERVASVLSVGTTKSALSFEKLATALPVVQTAAAKTGFTIEDTVAMLGKLTDNGINAASAATQLRKILNDSTTAGTKLANALGGPVKSFDELVVALDKAGKAGQNHADSVALVNSKNATALDILRDMAQQREVDVNGVKKQTSALQELRDSITDCSEGMRGMQDEQLNTLQGSITILNSAWEGLMLTFSESNGVIKTVVDSLTELLGAWTKWRNRNAGGDSAIKFYEASQENIKSQAETRLGLMRGTITSEGGNNWFKKSEKKSDDEILKEAEEAIPSIIATRDEMRDLLLKWEEAEKETFSGKAKDKLIPDIQRVFGDLKGGNWAEQMQKAIAKQNDELAINQYISSSLTTPEPDEKTEDEKDEDRTKSRLATLKAQYEEQEKLHIASLDRMHMKEEDYEAEVYRIKRETLQKIADLYQEETAEKARANAAISQLDIAYQGTQMRLANKGIGSASKPKEEKLLNYSQEGIANLGSQIKGKMASEEIGSEDYKIAAENLLDFTTFENLLKAATERGVQIDPKWMASLFEDIKIGADVDPETWQAVVDSINELIEGTEFPAIKLDVKTGGVETLKKDVKDVEKEFTSAMGAVGALGNALQQIEDPAAKVAGLVAEAIATIALTFAKSLKGTFTPWDWIAAAASGTATMIATIAAIKSATSGSYASGGIIPGNSFSGDNLTANVNSGELILNRAQQGAIAGQLESNPMGNLRLSTEISGTNLRIVMNNDNRARGGQRGFYSEIH